ncbi:MAG: substrate-binding and vWA domain-containing protein [Christensenellales bacterium]|jgi:Ca-activated chloride channel family protein
MKTTQIYSMNKRPAVLALLLALLLLLSACTSEKTNTGGSQPTLGESSYPVTLRIVSGSENKELEPLLSRFAKENRIALDMKYQGSVEISRILGQDEVPYDAVWPASSMWISIGDTKHRVKYTESISITPVVFGIRQSLAKELGFVDKKVSVRDILAQIQNGKLSFCMTNATQSNSGCSAYIGFLYALLNNPEIITSESLQQEGLRADIQALLKGVDRSSGSSEWLKTLFLQGNFDAMVNYESLILSTNEELLKQGREPLHLVYPYDGLSISDAPLGYVDQGDKKKEEAFLKLRDFLMSEKIQKEIQRYGRRTGYAGILPENLDVWRKEWGADTQSILSPIRMPDSEVLWEALGLYQTQFRKPSLTAYVLDFSGSMSGEPSQKLKDAMGEILLQQRAAKNLLQASQQEENIVILFSSEVISVSTQTGNSDIEKLYPVVKNQKPNGGTAMFEALDQALRIMTGYDLENYTPVIILMTDGLANGSMQLNDFLKAYTSHGQDIPVFCISFGDADVKTLNSLAERTHARVFDGDKNLIDAFKKAKGYN